MDLLPASSVSDLVFWTELDPVKNSVDARCVVQRLGQINEVQKYKVYGYRTGARTLDKATHVGNAFFGENLSLHVDIPDSSYCG